ncbi:MAG: hypothetical protein LBT74_06200 [Acidobacteriota bacterium]|jgi:hypothetical protein|nr:hypothetical protein [Acidobacteriota bacterium]
MNNDSTFKLISNFKGSSRRGEPVTFGLPLPLGMLNDGQTLQITHSDGNIVPCEWFVVDRWNDSSARWVLVTLFATVQSMEESFYFKIVDVSRQVSYQEIIPEIHVERLDNGYKINTGNAVFHLESRNSWPIKQVEFSNGAQLLDELASGIFFHMEDNSINVGKIDSIEIELQGKYRVAMLAKGKAQLTKRKRIDIEWRIEFFAGSAVVVIHNMIRNPHRAKHPGGYWELGDSGSILFKEIGVNIVPYSMNNCEVYTSAELASDFEKYPVDFELYQDSSGGVNYRSHNHINRNGHIPIQFRGYRINDKESFGLRATPTVQLKTQSGVVTLSMKYFWQNFPKAIEVSDEGLKLGLFPRQWDDFHELQGGEQKTHSFAMAFGSDTITDLPLDWFRNPLLPSLNPNWVAHTKAIPYLTPIINQQDGYELLVRSAIDGQDSFNQKREIIDEFGWRNFGDIYADHEAIYAKEYTGGDPLVSHYNNQYDPIAGFCYQWLRSGDIRWWLQFEELANHVVDIDIYHTSEDKSAYNNGLFWHTFHYIDAGLSTHRSYPRIGKSNGGGPANEHVYTTGLMFHYFLTGNIQSRDAAIGLGQYIIDIDDGRKTVFKWFSHADTGLASSSKSADYHGPGRGSGNALNALLDAHRLTHSSCFLEKAEQLIRRVSHPNQDIQALNLLDVENRWFYTVFLQALGKYLDYKREFGIDAMYYYAQKVLMHFARWMARSEYPLLQKPELLEYPTETWAAQDIRKSEIFKYASVYANASERSLFVDRAEFFFNESIQSLLKFSSHTLCRPVVLLLSYGWKQICLEDQKSHRFADDETEYRFSSRSYFVPQKIIAMRRLKSLLLLSIVLFAVAVVMYIFCDRTMSGF